MSEAESKLAEELVAELIYPLRNAVLYHRAVKASVLDPLTQVNNRSNLDTMLNREIRLAQRYGNDLTLIMVDIDHFKNINDRYGHLAGDAVLKALARCIVDCTRDSDAVYRYGGEEFCIILSNTSATGAARLAERMRSAIENLTVEAGGRHLKVTASLGIADVAPADDALSFIDRADRALYRSKRDGRNLVTIAV